MSMEVSIQKKFNGFDLDLSFKNENQKLGILGASGSGKSMTLKCIAGVIKPDSGRIVLNGKVLFDSEKKINLSSRERKVGYLFQHYALFPTMTVEGNIGIGIKKHKEMKRQIIANKIKEFRLEGLEKRYPWELSGGQQQRVALARMLVCEPDVIMLDEPFSALDSFLREVLQQQLIESLADYQGDVILVTHSRDEVYGFCERLMVVDKGKKLIVGEMKDIFENPVHVEVARLTGCKNISPIRKINEYTLEAIHWGTILKTNTPIGDKIRFVGLRAHDFIPMWEQPQDNYIPYRLSGRGSLPFEEHFYLSPTNSVQCDSPLCWFVQKDRIEELTKKGNPLYLHLPRERLFLLEQW